MARFSFRSLLLGATIISSLCVGMGDASAQYNSSVNTRMDRLERDLMLMQRQLSRGESGASYDPALPAPAGAAGMEVRLSQIEEQMRRLQGQVEQADFRNKQLGDRLESLTKDYEFRFQELEKKSSPVAENASDGDRLPPQTETNSDTQEDKSGKSSGDAKNLAAEEKDETGDEKIFDSPRDAYNYAFKLLRQAKHAEAGQAFERFIKKYPKDPLLGNAYYWLGESYYVQRAYVKAADSFRQGFETLPSGPKAPDNLLKLAMSLSALKEDKKSCVVLSQLLKKFGASSATIKMKAEQEIDRIGCSN